MSEKRKKQERDEAKAFQDEEREGLKNEAWWNTSAGLKEKFPKVAEAPNWQKFVRKFDDEKNCDHRLSELLRYRKWNGPSITLRKLNDLAEKAIKEIPEAGEKLGEMVMTITEGDEMFDNLVNDIKMQKQYTSGVSEAVIALWRFVEREKNLPTRHDLNHEAYRICNLKVQEIPLTEWLKNHSILDEFEFGNRFGDRRLYHWEQSENDAIRLHTYPEREGEPRGQRWPKAPTFSEVLGKAGLRGLE